MSPHLGRQSIVLLNTTEGAPGRYESTSVDADPVLVERCSLQAYRTERLDHNSTDVAIARLELFTPPDAPLLPTSKVRLVSKTATATSYTFTFTETDDNGDPVTVTKTFYVTDPVYDVDGEVAIWPDRNNRPHHTECYVKERRA